MKQLAWIKNPNMLLVYLLVYWGRTIFFSSFAVGLLAETVGLWPLAIVSVAIAVMTAAFRLGLTVGEIGGLPKGRRR